MTMHTPLHKMDKLTTAVIKNVILTKSALLTIVGRIRAVNDNGYVGLFLRINTVFTSATIRSKMEFLI